jgi:alpha-L-rhamnosidase
VTGSSSRSPSPPNTTATVHVPAANGTRVSESGRSVEEAEGVDLLRAEDEEAILSVGSGRYQFTGRVAR